MTHITIKNIGAITEASFNLNQVNVFMGPQGCGKSTIAKICSQCRWCEKNYILTGEEYDFYSGLIDFHRMDEAYFSETSEMVYESDWLKITLKGNRTTFEKKNNPKEIFQNIKIEYIPSERNFVATIPNLEKYNDGYDDIINFLKDWIRFKKKIAGNKAYQIPLETIDVNYKYDTNSQEDFILLSNEKKIRLQNSSSGQQSIIPLIIVCEYLFDKLYTEKRFSSSFEQDYILELLPKNLETDYDEVIKMQNFPKNTNSDNNDKGENTNSDNNDEWVKATKEKIWQAIGFSTDYNSSSVIIEEPEQNLFPKTQQELVYFLLEKIQSKNRNHELILTTHSPYILYALNTCLLGGLVKDNIPEKEKTNFPSLSAWINPKSVTVWEIENGKLKQIQDKDNIVSANYFDTIMTKLTDEYFQILSYYDDEE